MQQERSMRTRKDQFEARSRLFLVQGHDGPARSTMRSQDPRCLGLIEDDVENRVKFDSGWRHASLSMDAVEKADTDYRR